MSGHENSRASNRVTQQVSETDSAAALYSSWIIRDGNKTPVLFLHSLGTDHRIWFYQVAGQSDRTVGVMDARGHGRSQGFHTVSVHHWVEDIQHALDEVQIQHVILCGVSMGGVQALAFANTYPNRVKALVLADTFMEIPIHTQGAKIAGTAGKAHELGMDKYADYYLDNTLTTSPTATALRPELRDAIAGMPLDMYMASARTCFMAQVHPQFSGIPTLVLIGEKDYKTPVEMSQAIMDAVPDARLEVIPDAAHLSNIDNPSEFNRRLSSFVTQLDPH